MMTSGNLRQTPIHLGMGATATVQPEMKGDLSWYNDYGARTATDGREGRLVSCYSFDAPWTSWEMHPEGHEVVICTSGALTLHQEYPDGRILVVALKSGDFAINEPGVWHTADVEKEATAVFITSGVGTQHRPR